MPYELGNVFQGSSAQVFFKFLAEGSEITSTDEAIESGYEDDLIKNTYKDEPNKSDEDKEPMAGQTLPNTATNNYNLLLAGAFLFLSGGSLVYNHG